MDRDHRRRLRARAGRRRWIVGAAALLIATTVPMARPSDATAAGPTTRTDVVVYGGTPGGILAAVTASRGGASVVLLEPRQHLGGMMSSGLGWTDIGNRGTHRGYTGEFFDRTQALEGLADGRYHFQPHTAETAFRDMLHTTDVVVRYGERLPNTGGVVVEGARIRSLTTTTGRIYDAGVFIDATYEGDLMARSGVEYRLGREARSTYGESLAGVRPTQLLLDLDDAISRPFLTDPPGPVGSADRRIQDSNYRVCFSSDPANRVPFSQPAGYRSQDYDVYVRYLTDRAAREMTPARLGWILSISPLPNQKYDVNDVGPLSTAIPGANWGYPEASHATRLGIEQDHRTFTQGLFFHLAQSRRVPSSVRAEMAAYGLCKDEFADNGNWPWLLYLREGRRMVGSYVLRQSDIELQRSKPDIIGVASYRVDSHFVSRWVTRDDQLMVEGAMSLPYMLYAIPYRSITPKASDITNLLVPVAASASHVAQSSLRMEPQYMIMGEAAGEAAAMATGRREASTTSVLAAGSPGVSVAATTSTPLRSRTIDVQALDVAELQRRLKAHGAYLKNPANGTAAPSKVLDQDPRHMTSGG